MTLVLMDSFLLQPFHITLLLTDGYGSRYFPVIRMKKHSRECKPRPRSLLAVEATDNLTRWNRWLTTLVLTTRRRARLPSPAVLSLSPPHPASVSMPTASPLWPAAGTELAHVPSSSWTHHHGSQYKSTVSWSEKASPFACTDRWATGKHNAFGRVATHSHTCLNGPLSRTTRVSQYQKGKTNLDFTEARDSEWQWHQLGHMQVCTSLGTDDHASTPPHSFLQAGWPSCCQQSQSTEGRVARK